MLSFLPHSQSTWKFEEQTKVTRCGKKSLMNFGSKSLYLSQYIHVSNTLLSFSFKCRVERSYIIYKAFLPVEGHTQLLPYMSAVSATHKRGGGNRGSNRRRQLVCTVCMHEKARASGAPENTSEHVKFLRACPQTPPTIHIVLGLSNPIGGPEGSF